MYPIILERDTKIINWPTYLPGWSTSEVDTFETSLYAVSDGLVYTEYATAEISREKAITATKMRAIGLNITGPEAGTEFTPYQISAVASAEHPEVRPFLFVAESIASPTSDAAGDLVTNSRLLAVAQTSGIAGSTLEKEITIVINPKTADRSLFFGIGMAAVGTATSLTLKASISVRRLAGVNPAIYNTRKL